MSEASEEIIKETLEDMEVRYMDVITEQRALNRIRDKLRKELVRYMKTLKKEEATRGE